MRMISRGAQPAVANEIIDAFSEGSLFVFVRRARINNQELCRVRDQITVCVRCRRASGRAHRKTNVVGLKLHSPVRSAMSFRNRKESRDGIFIQTLRQAVHRVQHRRHDYDFASLPLGVRIARGDPFSAFQFRICR